MLVGRALSQHHGCARRAVPLLSIVLASFGFLVQRGGKQTSLQHAFIYCSIHVPAAANKLIFSLPLAIACSRECSPHNADSICLVYVCGYCQSPPCPVFTNRQTGILGGCIKCMNIAMAEYMYLSNRADACVFMVFCFVYPCSQF